MLEIHNEEENKNESETGQVECLFFAAKCHQQLGNYKKSIENFKKCLQLDQNHFGASTHLANLMVQLGEHQRAMNYF